MDKISYAIENFKNMQELIRFADQKAGAVIVVYGFILSMSYEASKSLEFFMPCKSNINMLGMLVFMVGATLIYLIVAQVYYIFNSILKPRLANSYKRSDSCLYYFEHVAAKDKAEVLSCFASLDEATMISDLSSQIFEVSSTLNIKMQMVSNVINSLTYVVICMIVFMLLIKIL